jgi:hypothetical protein
MTEQIERRKESDYLLEQRRKQFGTTQFRVENHVYTTIASKFEEFKGL